MRAMLIAFDESKRVVEVKDAHKKGVLYIKTDTGIRAFRYQGGGERRMTGYPVFVEVEAAEIIL